MTELRNSTKITHVRASLATFWGELLDVDENYAESYLTWCIEQLKENKKNMKYVELRKQLSRTTDEDEKKRINNQIQNVKPNGYPRNIQPGDVVLVKYGINLGDEISDLQNDQSLKENHGHYSVVLAQKGFMFLVVPLTSQRQQNRENPDLEMSIDGLDIGDSGPSHVMFNHIQSVHIRRIKNIQSLLPDGKTSLSPDIFKELIEKIHTFTDN